jgi:hypothetical protein
MDEFEATVLSDLAALKSQMAALIGLGQPGRLSILEERMERHEIYLQKIKGLAGTIFVLITMAQLLLDYLKR